MPENKEYKRQKEKRERKVYFNVQKYRKYEFKEGKGMKSLTWFSGFSFLRSLLVINNNTSTTLIAYVTHDASIYPRDKELMELMKFFIQNTSVLLFYFSFISCI